MHFFSSSFFLKWWKKNIQYLSNKTTSNWSRHAIYFVKFNNIIFLFSQSDNQTNQALFKLIFNFTDPLFNFPSWNFLNRVFALIQFLSSSLQSERTISECPIGEQICCQRPMPSILKMMIICRGTVSLLNKHFNQIQITAEHENWTIDDQNRWDDLFVLSRLTADYLCTCITGSGEWVKNVAYL